MATNKLQACDKRKAHTECDGTKHVCNYLIHDLILDTGNNQSVPKQLCLYDLIIIYVTWETSQPDSGLLPSFKFLLTYIIKI